MQFIDYVYFSNMAGRAAKQLLRKELKSRLSALSDSEKLRQSKLVSEQLLSTVQYRNSRRVSLYLNMKTEVHTDEILRNIFESGRECFVPRYIGSVMDMVKLHSMNDFLSLLETSWEIKQPADDERREDALETGGLDLIIIPGLGFSRQGDRLGRGKGFYDTYLHTYQQKMKAKPATVALAFYEQICDTIPTTDQDVPIDLVLFEDKST